MICDAFYDSGTCGGATSSSENVILIDDGHGINWRIAIAMELIGVSSTFKLENRNVYFFIDENVYRIRVFI